MDVLRELKTATFQRHVAIESVVPLMRQDVVWSRYQANLFSLCGFVDPLEPVFLHLKLTFGPAFQRASAFLTRYGLNLGFMWRPFENPLWIPIRFHSERHDTIVAARETFGALHRWLVSCRQTNLAAR